MASPIGHTLCGCIVYVASTNIKYRINWKVLLGLLLIANLADIDYVFGFIVGKPNFYHHQFTHSVGFSLILAAGVALYWKVKYLSNYLKTFFLIFTVYGSHVLVDYFSKDTSLPYGEQLFWPFSTKYFLSSFSIFRDIHKANTSGEFFSALFSYYNLTTVLTEITILGSLLIVTYLLKNRVLSSNLKLDT